MKNPGKIAVGVVQGTHGALCGHLCDSTAFLYVIISVSAEWATAGCPLLLKYATGSGTIYKRSN